MTNKYNLALIPVKASNAVINYAQFLSNIADDYLLGEHSLPHVTLYQFQANESEIKSIWQKAKNELAQTTIELTFETFSCTTSDNVIYCTSLLPDKRGVLMKMHNTIADIVNQPVKPNYDPHMTLINTKDPAYKVLVRKLSETYVPISDIFILALGKSDAIGQLTEIIHSCA